jgi:hypothetical protein
VTMERRKDEKRRDKVGEGERKVVDSMYLH